MACNVSKRLGHCLFHSGVHNGGRGLDVGTWKGFVASVHDRMMSKSSYRVCFLWTTSARGYAHDAILPRWCGCSTCCCTHVSIHRAVSIAPLAWPAGSFASLGHRSRCQCASMKIRNSSTRTQAPGTYMACQFSTIAWHGILLAILHGVVYCMAWYLACHGHGRRDNERSSSPNLNPNPRMTSC